MKRKRRKPSYNCQCKSGKENNGVIFRKDFNEKACSECIDKWFFTPCLT